MSLTRKFLGAALAALLVISTGCDTFKTRAKTASVSIFLSDQGRLEFICSGTSIKSPSKDYGLILTARHCVSDVDTNELYADKTGFPELISFSDNEKGPYYLTQIEKISDNEDLAILRVVNGGNLPYVNLGDETRLEPGDTIFNWSFPQGVGKLYSQGHFMASKFPYDQPYLRGSVLESLWRNAMPADITYAHGSSGSGIFDPVQQKLIGVVVGVIPDGMKILMPASRAINLLKQPFSMDTWRKNNPIQESDDDF